jgi:uncharacterized protein YdeI (YjbR/CyaY-like superfamily)
VSIRFFRDEKSFRAWLAKNHHKVSELTVGFRKKNSGQPSITYPEARDQALCFGWIDGVRHALDDASYTVRFTPRKSRSVWSTVNIARIEDLRKARQMTPAGEDAFAELDEKSSGFYSFENRPQEFDSAQVRLFQSNKGAWAFFQSQPPAYRRTATFYVVSAKREEIRQKRLDQLIADSAAGLRIKQLRRE